LNLAQTVYNDEQAGHKGQLMRLGSKIWRGFGPRAQPLIGIGNGVEAWPDPSRGSGFLITKQETFGHARSHIFEWTVTNYSSFRPKSKHEAFQENFARNWQIDHQFFGILDYFDWQRFDHPASVGGYFDSGNRSFVSYRKWLISGICPRVGFACQFNCFDPIDSKRSVIIAKLAVGSKVPITRNVDRFVRFNGANRHFIRPLCVVLNSHSF
jgi:hypothetical protein